MSPFQAYKLVNVEGLYSTFILGGLSISAALKLGTNLKSRPVSTIVLCNTQ